MRLKEITDLNARIETNLNDLKLYLFRKKFDRILRKKKHIYIFYIVFLKKELKNKESVFAQQQDLLAAAKEQKVTQRYIALLEYSTPRFS